MPRISVLINTYNYGDFLKQAIESVLSQSRPTDELIVVDDGSTDETDAEIRAIYEQNEKINWIRKENGGQLSAFQAGVLAATGDICFFLDADDYYHPDHLKLVEKYYDRYPRADFVFTDENQFRSLNADPVYPETSGRHDYGISIIRNYFTFPFIGNVTSTLSCRRTILRRLFPFSDNVLSEWRIRADDCLVYGAALAGANKHYYGVKTVNYRVHGNNHYSGREIEQMDHYLHLTRVWRFHQYLAAKFCLGDYLKRYAWLEFLTIPDPTHEDLDIYERISKSGEIKRDDRFSKIKRSCKKRISAFKNCFSGRNTDPATGLPHTACNELTNQKFADREELKGVSEGKKRLSSRDMKVFSNQVNALYKEHPLIGRMEAIQNDEARESSVLNRMTLPESTISDGAVILDIGANIGEFAKKCRKLFPRSTVWSVEADPATFKELKRNVAADPLIHVYNRAIYSHQAVLPFYSHENSLLSSLRNLSAGGGRTKCIMLEACSLDQFVSEQGVEDIVLLKIDTEGNDLTVLEGASELLKSKKLLYLILEFGIDSENQRHGHINDFVAKLTPYGFRMKRLGDWGVHGSAIYGNCLFERTGCRPGPV
jgi:FkbM family methyltransferase